MIDLSYLTEEEQEKIMSVLQRDGDLKRAEEKRIRRLKQSIEDENQLKYMTGEWFYKAKSKRHADTIHGAELIRASMRKKKPMTIYERIQAKELKEKTKSFMNNVGNSIYATPALSVLLKEEREEELEMEKSLASEASNLNKAVPEQPRQKQKHSSASSPKQRENPFNKSSLLVDDNPNGGQKPLLSASILPGSETPAREWLSQQKDVSRLHLPSNEFLESKSQLPAKASSESEMQPVPKPRTVYYNCEVIPHSNHNNTTPSPKNETDVNNSPTIRKSILKGSQSSSFNDSESPPVSVQDSKGKIQASPKTSPVVSADLNQSLKEEESLELYTLEKSKQVRFSTNVDERRISETLEPFDLKEMYGMGEDALLDKDLLEADDVGEEVEEEKDEEYEASMDNAIKYIEENDRLDKPRILSHADLSSPLQIYPNQDKDGIVSTSDLQFIPVTLDSNQSEWKEIGALYSLPGYDSSRLTNQVCDLDTGEILSEKDASKRTDPAFDSPSTFGKQILHYEIESPQVSDLQPTEVFQGHTPVTEENDIPKKRVTSVEPLDSRIQRNLNPTDLSHQEKKISPNTSDNNSEYDEEEMAMDVDKKGLELQDTFQAGLNLPSGVRKTSTFKESDLDSLRKPSEVMESIMPYYSLQEELPKATLPTDSGRGDQSSSETWKNSPSAEMAALKRRESRTSETSRSLQDIYSTISQPRNLDPAKNEMVLSTNDVSKFPPSSQRQSLKSDKMKRLSKSEQVLPENGVDTDSISGSSIQMDGHRKSLGSLTINSNSSGMASLSSQIGGSVMSIYSGDFRNDVKGRLQFSLDYIDKLNEFHIFVVRCSDLAAAEEKKNRSDPYVKTYLLQEKIKLGKKKTSVKKKTLNPVYNEILRYKVEKSILMAQILNLSVWHNDRFGHNSFLGEVEIEMKAWDWKNKKMEWYDLKPRTSSANSLDNRGNLKVALRHIPKGSQGNKTGEVHIWVKEAINLPQIRKSGVDPFVKCFILPDTSRKSRQKTRVVKKNPNPKFNHTMVYDGLRPDDLKDACIELSVWDHDKLVNHFLGGLRIGLGKGKSYGIPVDWMDSTEEEAFLWNKMLMEPNVWVENMLPLRMIMLSKMSGK
ncbi:synaptotagmin-like protein 2 isoform X5 [Callorhinchus milii]|uniref:synaptotagmin-like protein 2 isoform X5 n=1 Tax=Callorhinchus milii TaxID=7868 RepID=UPI001C3F93E5|nr:synaptotagmin-like protein 2 isoform X5 [Callorhinchus milii]